MRKRSLWRFGLAWTLCALAPGVARAAATVEVRDEAGKPVAGAEVFRGDCTLAGTTGADGRLSMPTAAAGEHVQVRKLVKTGATQKADHGDWGYHVYLTNVIQNNDGTQSDTILTGGTAAQAIVLKKDNAQIGLHVLGSVNYNATKTNLDEIAAGLELSSRYLFDITDGQMFIERSELFEDGDHWDSADVQYFPSMWPNANVGAFGAAEGRVYMPGPGFNGQRYVPGSWRTSNGFRTFTHEFGHHVFGSWDEYIKTDKDGKTVPASCTLDRGTRQEAARASFMQYQYDCTEMCADKGDNTHNADTVQGQLNKTSVWGTFVANWSGGEWTLRTPVTRGAVNPGPNNVSCTSRTATTIKESAASVCPPFQVQVTADGGVAADMPVVLHHGGVDIDQGTTDANGRVAVYGAASGDTISAGKVIGNKSRVTSWFGETTVRDCAAATIATGSRTRFFYYELRPRFRLPKHEIDIQIPFEFDPMIQIDIKVEVWRAGQRPIPVALKYDVKNRRFAGTVPFEPGGSPSFQLRMIATDDQMNVIKSTASFEGLLYHAAGPGTGPGGLGDPVAKIADAGWELTAADHPMGLSVGPGSLPDGTSVTVGRVDAPFDPPMGLVIAGGPFSVQPDASLTGQIGLRMAFDAERSCGFAPGTASVYHLVGSDWMPVDAEIDMEHHVAYAVATEPGLYAVMAAPANDKDRAPEIRCGESLQFSVPAGGRLDYQADPAQATSACGDAVVTGRRSDGGALESPYPVGRTTIEWTATTAAKKTASCTQEIVVTEEPKLPDPVCGGGCCCSLGGIGGPGANGGAIPWLLSLGLLAGMAIRTRARRGAR